ENRNISVFVTTYNMLMSRGTVPTTLDQHHIEENIGYTKVKDKANDLLKRVAQGEGISHTDTDEIVSSISEQLETIDRALIFQCINASKPIDEYLRRHCINVGLINGLIGKWLELPKKDVDELVLAGLVHDIGKTKIPSQILDAPRRLTVTEFEVMKMHPIYSQELLGQDNRFSEAIRLAARHHHEKMNGSGYPDGINISEISLFARITAVSDIYDAMVSRRSYKDANNPFAILSQLADSQFSELDSKLVKVFTDNMPKELVGKSVLLSDGSTGIAKFIMNNDLEHPLVEINGVLVKTGDELHCMSMIFEQ
ncbi:MAG: HD-GYP domain-containing protein, partial [Angelakisella sp.]